MVVVMPLQILLIGSAFAFQAERSFKTARTKILRNTPTTIYVNTDPFSLNDSWSLGSSSQLYYKNIDNEESRVAEIVPDSATTSNRLFPWWSRNGQVEESQDSIEQASVDEYLEFLDKRYNHLRDHELASAETKPKFSAWNWLEDKSSHDVTIAVDEYSQQNALYALGVAGLASKKLLQKYSRQNAEKRGENLGGRRQIEKIAYDVRKEEVEIADGNESFLFSRVSRLSQIPSIRKKISEKHRKKQLAVALFVLTRNGGLKPSQVAKAILKMGGGKKNLSWSFSVMSALTFILIQPLMKDVSTRAATNFHG